MTVINEYLFIPPNWRDNVSLKRRWQTTVLTSIDGHEQRSALLTWPKRILNFSPLTKSFAETAYVKRKLYKNLHNVWGIPFWMDRTSLISQATGGQGTLNVGSTSERNFEVGAPCVLLASYSSYEVGVIATVAEDQIVLEENLGTTWPSGTDVYPVLKARIKSGQVINLRGSRMAEIQVEAVEEYDDGITRRIGAASGFPVFKGYPIFDLEPDWAKQVEQGFLRPYDYLMFYGKSSDLSDYDETEFSLKFMYLEKSRSNLQKILDFFDDKMGRWGNLWIPSWQSDIRVTQAFGAGDTELWIDGIEFSSYWLDTAAGTNITILWPNGTRVNRKVMFAPSTNRIIVDSAIGKACVESDLERLLVSFLFFGRFNQDEIEVQYHTNEIGQTSLFFQTVFTGSPLS